jgi:hypothetical protein
MSRSLDLIDEFSDEELRAELAARGYTTVKTTSYRNAQERQRIAECRRDMAQERVESTERWAYKAFDEQRRLSDRLTFVYE